ncbi:MAG TPA: hypothetical protein VJX92_05795 [Methylomirabilota bacterium]|nr:hypothetical protein [Methylomirabilota bacterium]
MKLIHFILALGTGWYLADHDLSLAWSGAWAVAASLVLTLLTLVVQHWTIPPASRSRRGLTVFQGQFSRLLFGTIATIAVTAVLVVLIRQRLG